LQEKEESCAASRKEKGEKKGTGAPANRNEWRGEGREERSWSPIPKLAGKRGEKKNNPTPKKRGRGGGGEGKARQGDVIFSFLAVCAKREKKKKESPQAA